MRNDLIQLVDAHTYGEPVPPSRHNPEPAGDLERVVLKCLAKDPADRFQDVSDLSHALSGREAAEGCGRVRAAQWWRKWEEPV